MIRSRILQKVFFLELEEEHNSHNEVLSKRTRFCRGLEPMLWRREKSLSDIDEVDFLTIHSVERPGNDHDSTDEMCPVSVGLGRSNILP